MKNIQKITSLIGQTDGGTEYFDFLYEKISRHHDEISDGGQKNILFGGFGVYLGIFFPGFIDLFSADFFPKV